METSLAIRWASQPVALALLALPTGMAAQAPSATTSITATRAVIAPRIDGSDEDAAWRASERRADFRAFAPTEDGAPTVRTELRVAYDDRALYIFVRAFDSRPDSVVRLLARRDTDGPPNDQVQLFIDSFRDRRSGYEYIVNAAGVKSDYILFNDTGFDQSWDGVWDVATRVDSLGWSAEFAIPLQQLRFSDRKAPTFGIMVWRLVGRSGERVSWPAYRPSRSGYVSQTGTLLGLRALARTTSLQTVPYALARAGSIVAGADVRFQPTPSASVDATFNPDFGQVESDPAVLDLSGFEVFQAERRPFFLQGAGQLNMPLATDGSALLFHSRRIGRAPILPPLLDVEDAPTETRIRGAALVTARPSAATSVTALSAVTAQEQAYPRLGGARRIVEPRTHFGVARVNRELRHGRSGVGLMVTRVDRAAGDSAAMSVLPRNAQAAMVSTQHQTGDGNYRLDGWVAASDVRGTPAAMSLVQLSNVHGFQRPDDDVSFEPARTALRGMAAHVFLGKVAGGVVRYDASYRWISPGFDVNEMGFLTKAGLHAAAAGTGLRTTQPGAVLGIPYRSAGITLGFAGEWSAAGLAQSRGVTLGGSMQLPNLMQLQATIAQELGGAVCSMTCTRGGPALVDEPRTAASFDITGDPRRRVIPRVSIEWHRDDAGRSRGAAGTADVTLRARTNLDVAVSAFASGTTNDAFFYRRFGAPLDDTTHLTFARLAQPVRSLTSRVDYTLTRALSVQWYAQAYTSRADYSHVRELADARARAYDDRFRPYHDTSATHDPQGVEYRRFRSNAVGRWEYRPGSTLFVVWTHARDGFDALGSDMIAVKVSYWLNR